MGAGQMYFKTEKVSVTVWKDHRKLNRNKKKRNKPIVGIYTYHVQIRLNTPR